MYTFLLPLIHPLFFLLLGVGWYLGRLSGRWLAVLSGTWLSGFLLRSRFESGSWFFGAFVAVVDAVLVLRVIDHDIKI